MMLSDTYLLDRIVNEAILDLRAGRGLYTVTEWAVDCYVTRYGSKEKIASDYEIKTEFTKALVATLLEQSK